MGLQLKTYRDALAYLFERTTGGNKFGLERTAALLERLGDPHRRPGIFHVAGTNGKGSVCATLDAVLRSRGLRVGKYTSPHLVDYRERFVVNGVPVDSDFVVDFVARHVETVERLGATFFEATTAMAFAWFAEARVDAIVLETGLGGRLDSTNVVQPAVAGVTSIGIDHVEYLGATREAIAREKAGIFKRTAPAVIGEPDAEIAALLAGEARRLGIASVTDVWRTLPPRDVRVDAAGTHFTTTVGGRTVHCRTPLAGEHQASNTCTALAMLNVAADGLPSEAELQQALTSIRLPGRFQRVPPWIFDVAHNPDGAGVLAQTLAAVAPTRPLVALLCVLADKDWRGIMAALAPQVDEFLLTDAPTAPHSRSWQAREVSDYAMTQGWRATYEPDFEHALRTAPARAATILVTGSFHTVGDAMTRLQVDPLAQ